MQIPKSLVYETKQIFFELTESQGKTLLLHGDLHHDNILFDKKRGWLAIDPKGIIGEAEIEVSAFLKIRLNTQNSTLTKKQFAIELI